jgi:hypothetical protein
MDFALAISGVVFTAFCVWLGVRIVNRRERWAKRTAIALVVVVLVLYPLSVGPAYWLADNVLPRWAYQQVETVYFPLTIAMVQTQPTTNLLNWYLFLFINGLMPDDYPDDAPWPARE